jgi:hypothetical protein
MCAYLRDEACASVAWFLRISLFSVLTIALKGTEKIRVCFALAREFHVLSLGLSLDGVWRVVIPTPGKHVRWFFL